MMCLDDSPASQAPAEEEKKAPAPAPAPAPQAAPPAPQKAPVKAIQSFDQFIDDFEALFQKTISDEDKEEVDFAPEYAAIEESLKVFVA